MKIKKMYFENQMIQPRNHLHRVHGQYYHVEDLRLSKEDIIVR